jgi:Plasma-membrane choline transporter
MSAPVVDCEMETPVANPHHPTTATPASHPTSNQPVSSPHGVVKGEMQETRCRDPLFALLLYGNVVAIIAVAFVYGPAALSITTTNFTDYTGYVIATIIFALVSFGAAALGLLILMAIPETMIKVALVFTVVMALGWCVMSFLSGSIVGGVVGAIFFLLSLCYSRAVWGRIPFATVNLVTACTAVKTNWGVIVYSYFFTTLAGAWSVAWSVAFVGVFDKTSSCNEVTNVCQNPNYGYLFLLFVAFFFTHQVLQVRERE